MNLIQLLKFKKWETRLFKMPRLETPSFQMGMRVTLASGPNLALQMLQILMFTQSMFCCKNSITSNAFKECLLLMKQCNVSI